MSSVIRVVIVCVLAGSLPAAKSQSLVKLRETSFVRQAGLRIEPGLSYTWGSTADDFFRDYNEILGGKSREFSVPISGSLRISRHLDNYQSLGLSVGFTRATLRENYDYDPTKVVTPLAPAQNITQNMNLETIPLMACYDLYPVDRQFTTYVGAGVGIGFSHVQWYEDVTTSRNLGARSKGERFDDWLYHPALELRSGISLGFDGSTESAVRSGIRLECSYRFLPISGQFMRDVAKSFALPPPQRLNESYTLNLGGFAVHVGIMVVLRHSERPRISP